MSELDVREMCKKVCNGTISDEEYQYFLELCRTWGLPPLTRGCGFGSMLERMAQQDKAMYEISQFKTKQRETALKNKYKF